MKNNISKLLKNLFDLIQKFYNGEKFSTKEIASIYDVNLRTAQRYISYLKEAGFDIKRDKNKYYLKMPVGIESIIEIAKKFDLSIPLIDKLKTSIYYSKLDVEKIDLNKFEILEDAIKNKNKLEILYEDFDNKRILLTDIKPLKIVNFEGYWYLLVLNYKDEYRRYHINSMEKIKVLKETFFIEEDFAEKINNKAINIWYEPFKEPFLVELFLDEVATKYFKRLPPFKALHLKEEKDGTSIVTLEITDEMELLPFILKWIPRVKIISPKSLKENIANKVKEFLNE